MTQTAKCAAPNAMKRSRWAFVSLSVFAAGLLAWWVVRPEPLPSLAGRPLKDWVREVEPGGPDDGTQAANEVLYAAGPRIIPDLSRLVLRREYPLIARLPSAWIPRAIGIRYHDRVALKANATYVISVIAYRDPNCPEARDAVPALITALSSSSEEVRCTSAQALAAVGAAASNAVPKLVVLTTDESSSIRLCAVEALGRIGFRSTESVQAVRAALGDTNEDVRLLAGRALAQLESDPK